MSTTTRTTATAPSPGNVHPHPLALPVMLMGTCVVALDFFIVNVALASIERELQAGAAALQFVVAGYGLATCALLITCGRLGDLFGRRRMFNAGVLLFTVASLACGLASTAGMLVAARVVQGSAGALVQPQVLAMVSSLYAGEKRAQAFAAYGLALGLGAISGQLLGGFLIHANVAGLGWRSCFLINLPIGALILLASRLVVPEIARQPGRTLDIAGACLLAGSLLALALPLILGREQGWPAWSWLMPCASVLLLCGFVAHQRSLAARGGQAIVSPSLMGHRPFVLGLLVVLLFYCGNASFYYVLALYLQTGAHLSPLDAGLYFTVMASSFFAASLASPKMGRRFGAHAILAGTAILGIGHALLYAALASGAAQSLPVLLAIFIVQGAGIGFVMAPLSGAVLACVPPAHAGVASGIVSTAQQFGNALGVALVGIVFYSRLPGEGPGADMDTVGMRFGHSLLYLLLTVAASAALYMRFVSSLKGERK